MNNLSDKSFKAATYINFNGFAEYLTECDLSTGAYDMVKLVPKLRELSVELPTAPVLEEVGLDWREDNDYIFVPYKDYVLIFDISPQRVRIWQARVQTTDIEQAVTAWVENPDTQVIGG